MRTILRLSISFLILPAAMLLFSAMLPPVASAQELESLKQTLLRTGVFFRADAPYVLRNASDPFLPVYVEIINGVEKTGRSAITKIAPYVTREPLKLEGINVYAKPPGARRQFAETPLLLNDGREFTFDARAEGQPLVVATRWRKALQIPREVLADYLQKNFLGGSSDAMDLLVSIRVAGWPSQNTYLRVKLTAPSLPELAGWYRGDMHYHSAFTDNAAERGHPLDVTKQTALHCGLSWVVLADHSTDLNPENYAHALKEVQTYRDGRFLFIRGEEITTEAGNEDSPRTLHLVALPSPQDPDKGFSPDGAAAGAVIMGGDGSLANPAIPLKDALERVSAAEGFAFAAHPFDPISPILRGGVWDLTSDFLAPDGKGLAAGLVGLEPWNRATTLTADNLRDPYCIRRDADPAACFQPDKDANQYARLDRGIERGWKPLLQDVLKAGQGDSESPPLKVVLAAGSDAHGDFNYEATMDVVDFLSKPSRGISGYAEDNAFGKLSTVVYCPAGMGRRGENVLRALRQGQSVLSNGPLVVAGFDFDSDGALSGERDIIMGGEVTLKMKSLPPLQLQWASNREFGAFTSIQLIVGARTGEIDTQAVAIPPGKEMSSDGLVPVDLNARLQKLDDTWGYIRLEGRTRNSSQEEFRCYTNPVWIRVTVQ
jgi:hypothetical protein